MKILMIILFFGKETDHPCYSKMVEFQILPEKNDSIVICKDGAKNLDISGHVDHRTINLQTGELCILITVDSILDDTEVGGILLAEGWKKTK